MPHIMLHPNGSKKIKGNLTRVGIRSAKRLLSVRKNWESFLRIHRLAPKPADIKDWEALSADEKKLFLRQMEVYAGYAEQTDYELEDLFLQLKNLVNLTIP